jgi:hypothetical protein
VQNISDDDNERNDDDILESNEHDFLEAVKNFVIVRDHHHAACTEVTTRVFLERIAAAEQIAAKYN